MPPSMPLSASHLLSPSQGEVSDENFRVSISIPASISAGNEFHFMLTPSRTHPDTPHQLTAILEDNAPCMPQDAHHPVETE